MLGPPQRTVGRYQMTGKCKEKEEVDTVRRSILRSSLVGGAGRILVGVPSFETVRNLLPQSSANEIDLVPVDTAVGPEPSRNIAETGGETGDATVLASSTTADDSGRVTMTIDGEFEGDGTFGMEASPYLETSWVAAQSGPHTVTASFDVRGRDVRRVENESFATMATFLQSNLSVLDSQLRVANQRSVKDHVAGDESFADEAAGLLPFFASALLGGYNPVFRFIAGKILGFVLDEITGESGTKTIELPDNRIDVEFLATAGEEYTVRFETTGGFAGQSIASRAGFRGRLSAEYTLDSLTIDPPGTDGGRERHEVTVRGNGGGRGAFMLTSTGDVWQSENSESEIKGPTALDFVGDVGTDSLYFTGELSNFLMKGEATVLLDGERVDPSELGSAETPATTELPNTLTVESGGTKAGIFGVTVGGGIEPVADSDAAIRGSSAIDWVGSEGDSSTFNYSGEIVDFLLKGDADVYRNGDEIDPDSLGILGEMRHTLTVTKEGAGEGRGAFLLRTSGELWPREESEAVTEGSTALDFVGRTRGIDSFQFTGEVKNFLLKGEATVLLDGARVDPTELGSPETNPTPDLPNTLTVESAGTRAGIYAVTVDGAIEPAENSEAVVRGSSAIDWVGGDSGTDTLHYSGDIEQFLLKGDAIVYRNGRRVRPGYL